jgi:hypothetical protein
VIGIGPLPVIEFDLPREDTGSENSPPGGSVAGHWKLEALDRFAGGRPVAWIDDSLDQSCFQWAERREAEGCPTLLVPTEPDLGIEEAQVAVLELWADSTRRLQ